MATKDFRMNETPAWSVAFVPSRALEAAPSLAESGANGAPVVGLEEDVDLRADLEAALAL